MESANPYMELLDQLEERYTTNPAQLAVIQLTKLQYNNQIQLVVYNQNCMLMAPSPPHQLAMGPALNMSVNTLRDMEGEILRFAMKLGFALT